MTLNEVFDHLTYGELSHLNLTTSIDGISGVEQENKYRLMTHINLGVTELHKRFFLKENRVEIHLEEGQSRYVIEEPDLLKIERVLNDEDEELTLNQGNPDYGVTTTAYNTVHVGKEVETQSLTVVFRQDHPGLEPADADKDPKQVPVSLPRTHLEALLYFIASRVVNPVGFVGEGMHEGNNYAAKFERACQELKDGGYQISQKEEVPRLHRMGWV